MKIENIDFNDSMRAGWTMIELIFILVVIGILASIAIGKFTATRNDALLSTSVANMSICITDVSSYYTATNRDYSILNHPNSCDQNSTRCYDIVYAINGQDFNVSTNPTREAFCGDIEIVGGHLAQNYNFGGTSVQR